MLKLCFTNQLLVFKPELINFIKKKKEDFHSLDLYGIVIEMIKHGDITFVEGVKINEQVLESSKIAEAITKMKSELPEKSEIKENRFENISCDYEFWYTVLYCQIIQKVDKLYCSANDNIKRAISDRAKEFWKMVNGEEIDEGAIKYLLISAAISYVVSYAIKEDKTFIEAAKNLKSYNILKYLENYLSISEIDVFNFNCYRHMFG